MALTRKQDWQLHLHNHTEHTAGVEFVWGKTDCAHIAAQAVEAQTGVNLMDGISYASEAEAKALIVATVGKSDATLEDFIDTIAAKHDLQKLPHVNWAHVGDLALYQAPDGDQGVGTVTERGDTVRITGTHGMHRIPISKCKCAWAIDRGKAYLVHPYLTTASETK